MENYNKNVLIPGTLYARFIQPTGDVNYETFSSSARRSAVKKTKAPIRRNFRFSARPGNPSDCVAQRERTHALRNTGNTDASLLTRATIYRAFPPNTSERFQESLSDEGLFIFQISERYLNICAQK